CLKLATESSGTPDGHLLVVSRDLTRAAPAGDIAGTMQEALERWDEVSAALEARYDRLNAGDMGSAVPLADFTLAAPLPRAWQWLDGSAFPTHGRLMQKAFASPPIESEGPLM